MYEHYFAWKFSGLQYDQTQQLEQFVQWDLLDVFQARGGRNLKYKMKEHLLEFYKKLKIGSKAYFRKQMQDIAINEGESLDIYGMRLVELAELAFPNDKKECARLLCERYLSTIPPSITTKVQQCERQLRTTRRGP